MNEKNNLVLSNLKKIKKKDRGTEGQQKWRVFEIRWTGKKFLKRRYLSLNQNGVRCIGYEGLGQ